MKNIFTKIFTIILISGAIFGSFWYYKNIDFNEYIIRKNQIREQNHNLPSDNTIKIASLGHEHMYADFLWIDLIQYIGSNLTEGNYTDFSLKMIEKITNISPKFTTAYEWAMWLMPIPTTSDLTYSDEQKKKLIFPLQIAEKGIIETCDMEKVAKIFGEKLTQELWQKTELKNPCKSGMLPYIIAFYGGQLNGEPKTAENYYKVAGLSDDAPGASQVLAVISTADKNNPKEIAKNFFVMAVGGYDDTKNLSCINWSAEIFKKLNEKKFTNTEIQALEENFKNFSKPKANNSLGTQTCYDMAERGLKYVFIDFINTEGKKYSEIDKIDDLITKIGLEKIPTTPSQENLTFYKNSKTGLWEYGAK